MKLMMGCDTLLLAADRPVVIEVKTDPDVAPLPPHVTLTEARRSCHRWREVIAALGKSSQTRPGSCSVASGNSAALHRQARGIADDSEARPPAETGVTLALRLSPAPPNAPATLRLEVLPGAHYGRAVRRFW